MRGGEKGRDERCLGGGDSFNNSPGVLRRVLELVAIVMETFAMF